MPGLIVIDPYNEDALFAIGNDQAAAVYTDLEDDKMYFSDLSNIKEWEGDTATAQTHTWKSGRIAVPKPINPGAVKVDAASYNSLTFKIWAELSGSMSLITTIAIASNDPVRLPGGYTSNIFEIQVSGADRVYSVTIGESLYDMSAG